MAKHKLRIDYDDDTGEVTVHHRCTIDLAGHAVSHSEVVDTPDDAAAVLKSLLDLEGEWEFTSGRGEDKKVGTVKLTRRAYMERVTSGLAINHVAAVNDTPQPGVKRVKVGGTIGAIGASESKKV